MLDYIIIGGGLAGIAFAETALENKKSILVINNTSQNSSKVAAGLYNPVILKRFTEVWQAKEQIELLHTFYSKLESKLQVKLDYQLPLLRKFYSIEEQNNWFTASDKPNLSDFLSPTLITKKYNAIASPLGYGEVLYSGFVDTSLLLTSYHDYLLDINSYTETTFEYNQLQFQKDYIQYKDFKAKHIVFAEGYGMLLNPFFSALPLDGAKGELLLIKAPNLNLDVIIKTGIFIMPLGNDIYKVGATYNWEDKTNAPTKAAKEELLTDLKELIHCDFEVIDHLAGIRPTVKDRRPMLGTHPIYKNLHLLNGLGTRGVMLAPAMAKMLYENIEFGTELNAYVDIQRFKNFASSFHQNE
ncbi:MAG: FAD-dependent oxidoreductase [Bacteroidota bacterium]